MQNTTQLGGEVINMDEENKVNTEGGEENNSGGMNWMLVVVALVLILGAGYYYMTKNSQDKMMKETKTEEATSEVVTKDAMVSDENMEKNQVVAVEGGMFYFKPNTITVKKDQPVTITFTNKEGLHDFVVDDLNVKSEVIGAGKSTVVSFTPTKAGTYEFYCSVGDHKAKGMKGTLVVE